MTMTARAVTAAEKLRIAAICLSKDDLAEAEEILDELWLEYCRYNPPQHEFTTLYAELLYHEEHYYDAIVHFRYLATISDRTASLLLARCLVRGGERPVSKAAPDMSEDEWDRDQALIGEGHALMVRLAGDPNDRTQDDSAWYDEAVLERQRGYPEAAVSIEKAVDRRQRARARNRKRSRSRRH